MVASSDRPHEVEVFYDGACPLCMREINLLRRWDTRGRIRFTNIAVADFNPTDYGKTYGDFMAKIHGRLASGAWIEGVEVFRQLYTAVGFGWLVALTRWPGVSHGLEVAYRVFAKNRLRLTGRAGQTDCAEGGCTVPRPAPSLETSPTEWLPRTGGRDGLMVGRWWSASSRQGARRPSRSGLRSGPPRAPRLLRHPVRTRGHGNASSPPR